ncbi:hypothetical protein MKW98_007161, partial [Papaver atlanticum]
MIMTCGIYLQCLICLAVFLLSSKEAYVSQGGNKAMITVREQHISSDLASSTLKDCDIGIE